MILVRIAPGQFIALRCECGFYASRLIQRDGNLFGHCPLCPSPREIHERMDDIRNGWSPDERESRLGHLIERPRLGTGHKADTDRIRQLYADGMSRKEIAAELGCNYETVRVVLRERPRRTAIELVPEMQRLRREGLSLPEIARTLGVGETSVKRYISRHESPHYTPPPSKPAYRFFPG